MPDVSLYLLKITGTRYFKIGISTRPCTRLDSIACGQFKGQINIVGVWPACSGLERQLHRRFANKRVPDSILPQSGRTEWFLLSKEDVQEIRSECALFRMKQENKPCRL